MDPSTEQAVACTPGEQTWVFIARDFAAHIDTIAGVQR